MFAFESPPGRSLGGEITLSEESVAITTRSHLAIVTIYVRLYVYIMGICAAGIDYARDTDMKGM